MPCRERFPNRSHPAPPGKSRFFKPPAPRAAFYFPSEGKRLFCRLRRREGCCQAAAGACTICLDSSRRAGCPHPAAVNRCISFKPVLLMWCCGWGAFRLLQLALQERREILCSPSEGGGGWCPDSFSPSAAFIFPSPVNLTKLFYASVSFFGILYMIGEERRDCRPFFRKRTVFSVSARSAPFTERM